MRIRTLVVNGEWRMVNEFPNSKHLRQTLFQLNCQSLHFSTSLFLCSSFLILHFPAFPSTLTCRQADSTLDIHYSFPNFLRYP